jgi:DsbC/DsbD-like thiol-disulfide interchange protein
MTRNTRIARVDTAEAAQSTLSHVLLAVTLAIICALGADAQSFAGSHAKIALVAENGTLKPGQTASIGLFFDLEQGWHIYWVNPGDSGEAPRVQWNLPKGFRAGEIRWPVPVRLVTGSVIDYGYQGRVLLAVPLQVPADYNPSATAKLAADVKYLICREVCIPAKAHAELLLPPAKGATPDVAATHQLFEDAQGHLPKPLPAGAKAQVRDDGKTFVLSLETGSPEAKASFFPLEEDQLDNDVPQSVTSSRTGIQITLKKSDQLSKPISVLKGVVVFSPDRAYEVAAPIAARH